MTTPGTCSLTAPKGAASAVKGSRGLCSKRQMRLRFARPATIVYGRASIKATMRESDLSRRQFIRFAAGATCAVSASMLAACQPSPSPAARSYGRPAHHRARSSANRRCGRGHNAGSRHRADASAGGRKIECPHLHPSQGTAARLSRHGLGRRSRFRQIPRPVDAVCPRNASY